MSDLPALMEIERASFSTPWRRATFEDLLARDDADLVAVSTPDGRLLGYAVGWTVADQAELGNIAVAAAARGQGVGRALVLALLDRVRQRGAAECYLEVREGNHAAQCLYDSCGFRLVGRRRGYYTRPNEDALLMRAIL